MSTNPMHDEFLSPQAAATFLADLPRYEERLTARAYGMTMMAFGIANAATALAYAHVSDWFEAHGIPWLLSLVWLPFILSAGILTGYLWRTHALTLRGNDADERGWLPFVGFSFLYIAILAGVALIRLNTAIPLTYSTQNLVVLGLFTLILGAFLQRRYKAARMIRPTYAAGILLLVLAPLVTLLGLAAVPESLVSAIIALVAWMGAGIATARMG